MAEVVVPKRWAHDGALRWDGAGKGRVALECEIVSPPSRAGRSVTVIFDSAAVTDALLILRGAAIDARMATLDD
jgi:hypothetical protein